MRSLHAVVPMAGAGSRFTKAGITTPKPLIPVEGRPMFMHSLDGLDIVGAKLCHSFIIRRDHDQEHNLGARIQGQLPSANIISTDEEPRGPLVDAYRAREFMQASDGVFMTYCDVRTTSGRYFKMLRDNLLGNVAFEGALLLFNANSPRYGYAQLEEGGTITEIAEKRVISPYAIAGGHYIATPDVLDQGTEAVLADPVYADRPELYITDMYAKLIELGGKVVGVTVDRPDEFVHFGTPEELEAYRSRGSQPSV